MKRGVSAVLERIDVKSYWERDRLALWHPYTRRSDYKEPFPLITRGDGVFLFDSEGSRYFDAVSSWWACSLGHNHPRIVNAIKEQAGKLQHSILGNLSHPGAVDLAWRLSGMLGGERNVLFASDGASAVEAALKIALQYWSNVGRTGKKRILSFTDAYHGDTMGAMSVGYMDVFHHAFKDAVVMPVQVEPPRCSACSFGLRPDNCRFECFKRMESAISAHADELAAVIVEPLCQGAAGMNIYPAGYLTRLAEACSRHKVLLIVDEVAMGFGKTGKMFAFEHAGIDPDIVCMGKALSGGYLPISATVVKNTIYESFSDTVADYSFYHGHTFAGNPIACAAALAALDIYEQESIPETAAVKGKFMASTMAGLEKAAKVKNTRFFGMIAAVELEDNADKSGRYILASHVRRFMLENRILVRPLGNVVYLMPPVITPEPLIADAVEKLKQALAV